MASSTLVALYSTRFRRITHNSSERRQQLWGQELQRTHSSQREWSLLDGAFGAHKMAIRGRVLDSREVLLQLDNAHWR